MMIRQQTFLTFSALLFFLTSSTFGKIITVNTTNNVSPAVGETNLVQAIALLEDGDAIHFNIPGPGPFHIATPPRTPDNGYPAITNHNVTIDGYSQPGSSPNSNTILSSNNANITIVIDSRAGGGHVEDIGGFDTTESTALFVKGATNVTIRGLCFLGPGIGQSDPNNPHTYATAFGLSANYGHVNGCRFGLDLDGTSIYRFQDAVAGFATSTNGPFLSGTTVGVDSTALDATIARSQFNVIVGEFIPVILEGNDFRIAGNFFNVFPDGITDFNVFTDEGDHTIEAFIEIGYGGNNLLLGTDSDGRNDQEERNIFGGVTVAKDSTVLEFYRDATCTNLMIAGNYFGVAVDGQTRFTNSMTLITSLKPTTTARIGSDLDGLEDELEANLFSNNYPFDTTNPNPTGPQPPLPFVTLNAGSRISFRGNKMMGNDLAPVSYATGTGNNLQRLTNIYRIYLVTTNLIFPTLSTNSSQGRLRGICSTGKTPYTNLIIDVYYADPEGWTNGQRFQMEELAYIDPSTSQTAYYGFAQGRTYIGSFLDNGPQDLDPTPGQFEFDISSLNLPIDTLITATANYSADPPGTPNGRTETTDFAIPITLQPSPRVECSRVTEGVTISWPTNAGTFFIESSSSLSPSAWQALDPQPTITTSGTNYTALVTNTAVQSFFRLAR